MTVPEPAALLDAIHAATDAVRARVAALTDADVASPSPLPGWTVGHVVSHICLNAEAFVRVADDLQAGRTGIMYPAGFAARNADIDAGARRSAAELSAHFDTASAAFATAWSSPPPLGTVATVPGADGFASEEVPFRRLREVAVHGVDMGLTGLTPADWPETYVEIDLPDQWRLLRHRTTGRVGFTDETGRRWTVGEATAWPDVDRRTVLAWLLDRARIDGAPDLIGWGDRDHWLP